MGSPFLEYSPPPLFSGGHVQTIFPSLFRRVDSSFYTRERMETDDGDFIDLDWSLNGSRRLAVISHGLEGSSRRAYVAGMARALAREGWDVLAWNFRSCSGTVNRKLRFYHNGSSDDLGRVIDHAAGQDRYDHISLVGFSLGGNVTLVYLGKEPEKVNPLVKSAAVFSVPCDLAGASIELAKPSNKIYMDRFLRMLHKKVKAKMKILPGRIDDRDFHLLKNFKDYDDRYTAPLHGFKSAEDYWDKCGSGRYITGIQLPVLIANAKNDPFLSTGCYPIRQTAANPNVTLVMPDSGGHVGFVSFNRKRLYWSEHAAITFLGARNT